MDNRDHKVRKQMYDLTEADYRSTAVWEFCLDEEAADGQDETTVRPSALVDLPAYSDRMFLVAADVVLGDGSTYLGYLFSDENDVNAAMGAVFINGNAVTFSVPGSFAIEMAQEYIEKRYQEIGLDRKSIFPVSLTSVIPVAGQRLSFRLDGFVFNGGPRKGETTR